MKHNGKIKYMAAIDSYEEMYVKLQAQYIERYMSEQNSDILIHGYQEAKVKLSKVCNIFPKLLVVKTSTPLWELYQELLSF